MNDRDQRILELRDLIKSKEEELLALKNEFDALLGEAVKERTWGR